MTPSGSLWVAPDGGWKGGMGMTQNYVSFYRYKNPSKSLEKQEFKYPIWRFPQAYYPADRVGGIAEIIAFADTHLLVLERCYVQSPQERVIALLSKCYSTNF